MNQQRTVHYFWSALRTNSTHKLTGCGKRFSGGRPNDYFGRGVQRVERP